MCKSLWYIFLITENDGDTEMNDIGQVDDKANDDVSEGEQNESAEVWF